MSAYATAAAICRRYAANLSELPQAREGALECAALIDDAAKLSLTVGETRAPACQAILEELFGNESGESKGFGRK